MGKIVDRSKRVFRFFDDGVGAYQITAFPDSAPDGETPLLRRTGFITDIEVFAEEGFLLARDLGEQDLADDILTKGLDWEHAVANHNGSLIPAQPHMVSDAVAQGAIDALDDATEKLVAQVNQLSASRPKVSLAIQKEFEERRQGKA